MPAFSTSQASELLEPGLKSIFLNRFRRWPEEYSTWSNVLGSTRNFEEDLTFAGFGTIPEKGETRVRRSQMRGSWAHESTSDRICAEPRPARISRLRG